VGIGNNISTQTGSLFRENFKVSVSQRQLGKKIALQLQNIKTVEKKITLFVVFYRGIRCGNIDWQVTNC